MSVGECVRIALHRSQEGNSMHLERSRVRVRNRGPYKITLEEGQTRRSSRPKEKLGIDETGRRICAVMRSPTRKEKKWSEGEARSWHAPGLNFQRA